MAEQDKELLGYLAEIVSKTRAQQLPWVKVNPTTYVANVASANARMSLQKVVKPATPPGIRRVVGMPPMATPGTPASATFVFQVLEASGTPVINLNAPAETEIYKALSEIFEAIEEAARKKGLDLLKKIVSG